MKQTIQDDSDARALVMALAVVLLLALIVGVTGSSHLRPYYKSSANSSGQHSL